MENLTQPKEKILMNGSLLGIIQWAGSKSQPWRASQMTGCELGVE